jgi:hypothetical protein
MKLHFSATRNTILKISLFLLILTVIGAAHFISNQEKFQFRAYLRTASPEMYLKVLKGVVYPFLRQQVIGATLGENIDSIILILSRKDVAHFDDLYREFETGNQTFYNQHNKWRKAEMIYKGEKYKIKLKSHGRSPTDHRNGKHISLGIKLSGKKQIKHANRFNLIIHERIAYRSTLTDDLASRFDLIFQKRELVKVKINNWDEKLYFFEHRLNSSFMETEKKSSFKLFSREISNELVDKSMIFTGNTKFDPIKYALNFDEVMKFEGISIKNGTAIRDRYLDLNKAISKNNFQSIDSFFDSNYITSFNAVRQMLGHNGHGSNLGNLYVFFNMANGKFYPAFTRDHITAPLPNEGLVEKNINSWVDPFNKHHVTEYPMFHVLSQNDNLRQIRYKKIFEFIEKHEKDLPEKHEMLITKMEKIYYLGWIKALLRNLRIDKFYNITKNNFSVMKKYLSDSNPEVSVSYNANWLLLSIKPNSMASLGLKQLSLNSLNQIAGNKINLKITSWFQQNTSISGEYLNNAEISVGHAGGFNLTDLVKDLTFFDGLNPDSIVQRRNYKILIESDSQDIDFGKFVDKMNFTFHNNVTNQAIASKSVAITGAEIIPKDILVARSVYENSIEKDTQVWKSAFQGIQQKGQRLIISQGDYIITEDVILPKGRTLVLNAGTNIYIAKNVGILVQGAIVVDGTSKQPVTVSSLNKGEPFGSLAVLGEGTEVSSIRYLKVSNGSEKWINGAYFSAAFSIHYNKSVLIENSEFTEGKADDGLNIKYSDVILDSNIFKNNFADQVDLDYSSGIVKNSKFLYTKKSNPDGDGLDISGSQVYISANTFNGFDDKGISIGEESQVFVFNNIIKNNNIGSAVKDLSRAYFLKNEFSANRMDIQAYQKKKIYGGGKAFVRKSELKLLKTRLDKKSSIHFFPKIMEIQSPRVNHIPINITEFFKNLEKVDFL